MTENEIKVRLVIDGTEIPATLNGGKASKALLAKLPHTLHLQRYAHDYCGVMDEPLPYDAADLHSGWRNGDIAFAKDGNYFAILYKDEEVSQQYDGMVTLGALSGPPSVMETFDASIWVRIESA